jgi:DNA-binding PucR family transcriptional regulator
VVVLGQRQQDGLLLPPGVLADWTAPEPCLLVPDPDGPGRQAAIDRALRDRALRARPAAIGPSVPLARAAMSLRWARHALALARAGVIPAGPVHCDQHLSTLLILADEDLAAALRGRRLAPLARLRPAQRDRIAETLLAWLQLGENAAEVAQRIHVHPQTVRYRMRQIHELFGDQLRDPDRRFELQLALRIRTLAARRDGPEPES